MYIYFKNLEFQNSFLISFLCFNHFLLILDTVLGQLKANVPGNPNVVLSYQVVSQTVSVTADGVVKLIRELDREVRTLTWYSDNSKR